MAVARCWLKLIVPAFACLVWATLLAQPAWAQRTITADEYRDKLHGMWFGQLIGNHSGRPFEGSYTTREAAPDEEFEWIIKTSYEDPWTGDDDTNFEYLYLHTLQTYGIDPTYAEIQSEWDAHVTISGIYIANRQAKYLMNHGFTAPDTGAFLYNMHAYAIDSQITTESLGAITPGIRQWALDTTRKFGGVTNEGYSLHAAEFYAALYAAATFENDVNILVELGQQAIPQSSRSWRAVQDVLDWYTEDMLDSVPDWRETRRKIYDGYRGSYSYGRYRNWIESTINLAITTMALLYGQGDFEETVRIGVLSGFDADCNPATAGGLIGMVLGYEDLPAELTGPATDHYKILNRPGLPEYDTITGVAASWQTIAEQVIVANGGTVGGGLYSIPDNDPVTPDPEMFDPAGPSGLVAAVLNVGGTVNASASIDKHDPSLDRNNLEGIIDGITDVRYDGHLPYDTYDGQNSQPAGGDFYQLDFSRPVRFDGLTFYEGDLRWNGINNDPRVSEPSGGYFNNLTVEVQTSSNWVAVNSLEFSEPLDPYTFYQVINLDFDPVSGDSVRIRGSAGGTDECTSIVELVVTGTMLGDFNADGDLDLDDFTVLVGCLAGPDGSVPSGGCSPENFDLADYDDDLDDDLHDFAVFATLFTGPL